MKKDDEYLSFMTSGSRSGYRIGLALNLLVIIAAAFLIELTIMMFLNMFPSLPPDVADFLDAGILAATLSPLVYFLLAGPMAARFRERRENIETLDALIHHSVDGIMVADPQTAQFMETNESMCDILGYSRDELLSLSIADIHPVERLDGIQDIFRGMAEGLVTDAQEIPFQKKDGGIVYLDIRAKCISLGGRPYLMGFFRDITERKKAEDVLLQSEALYRSLANNFPGIVYRIYPDRECSMEFFNEMVKPLTGYSMDELDCGGLCRLESLILPEDRDRVVKTVRKAIENEEPFAVEYRLRCKNGEVRYFTERGRSVGSSGVIEDKHVDGFIFDVTEQKRAQLALEESEERYRAVVRDQTELICRFTPDLLITFVNEAAARHMGRTPQEAVGMSFAPMLPDDRREQGLEQFQSLTLEHPIEEIESQTTVSGNGDVRWHHWTYRGIFDADGNLMEVQAVGRDITERQKAEEDIRKNNRLLEAIHKVQTAFIVESDVSQFYASLHEELVRISDSEYGFIGEVSYDEQDTPSLMVQALTNIAWDEDSRRFYEQYRHRGRVFRRTDSLYGAVMKGGGFVYSNDPGNDPRSCGLPEGHPPLRSFLGIPFLDGKGELLAVAGVCNREEGYDEELVAYLQPFISTCERIIEGYRDNALRREAQHALKESEATLAAAQRIAHIGSWSWDIPSNTLTWSEETYRIFGFEKQNFCPTYDAFLNAVHQEDREIVHQAVESTLQTNAPYSIEHRIVLPGGEIRIVHEQAEIELYENGDPVRMVGMVQDITGRKRNERALNESREGLATAQRIAHMGSWHWDVEENRQYWTDEIYRIFGLEPQSLRASYAEFIKFVHPDDRILVMQAVSDALEQKQPYSIEHRIVTTAEKTRVVHEEGEVAFNIAGEPLRMVGTVQDITERKESEARMRKLSMALEENINIIFITDSEGRIEYVNSKFEELTGYSREEALGQDPFMLGSIGEESLDSYVKLWETVRAGKPWRGVSMNHRKDGKPYWVNTLISPLTNEQGEITNFLAFQEDITETVTTKERLRYLSEYDDSTGLLNRNRFITLLEAELKQGLTGVVLLVDIDGLKLVNDKYGNTVGDDVLRRMGSVIKGVLRQHNVLDDSLLSRPGEDEFALLIPGLERTDATDMAEAIRRRIEKVSFTSNEIYVTVSIGAVLIPEHGTKREEILLKGDAALLRAKQLGHNRTHVYSPEDRVLEHMHLRTESKERIIRGLNEDCFEPWFQPILNVQDGEVHYEALARLRLNGSVLLPGDFLNTAEIFGLIGRIDRQILKKTFIVQAESVRSGSPFVFSLNLSGKDIEEPEMLDFIKKTIRETGASPDSLIFEITETEAINDLERAIIFIRELRDIGCRFSLDDFGVGFTSFVYLTELKVDYIKIDGSFIRRLHEHPRDQLVVKSLIEVARGLGIKTVAEFVETAETLEILKNYGIDYVQGYFIGKPEPYPAQTANA